MSKYIFFLGHQPHISIAELEAVFGADAVLEAKHEYAILELQEEPNIDHLGGTTKISQVLKIENVEQDIEKQILEVIQTQISEQKSEKLKLGVSIYSVKNFTQLNKKFIQKTLEQVRSDAKNSNPSLNLRTVEPKSSERTTTLSTAQLVHQDLLKNNGLSLDLIISTKEILVSKTIQAPNLKKYTLRDYGKPKPSGINGMLPPKLAQILINLSGARTGKDSSVHILDPFCGSGTVLQEALMIGIECSGTDLNPEIVEDAKENLEWLAKRFNLGHPKVDVKVADATSHQWPEGFTHVVCEGYLGTALSRAPSETKLKEIIEQCNSVAEGFLNNIHKQLKEQTLVIALPCWFIDDQVIKLPVVENLSALGYNKMKSKKISEDLIYHRENQFVGRDIYVLKKK